MGLFETYRIAGGEAGMKKFMAQFGPALKWPWTKLTDVPEFTDELVELISSQSDAQSGHLSISELEAQRDENLVGFMRFLKDQNWGAGQVITKHEAKLQASIGNQDYLDNITGSGRVLPSWIDYNGHMTEYRYGQILSDAGDVFLKKVGFDINTVKTVGSFYTVESHVNYKNEMKLAEVFNIKARVLAFDNKRIHLYQTITNDADEVIGTGEQLYLFIDANTKKVGSTPKNILEKIGLFYKQTEKLEIPQDAGKVGKPLLK